MDFQASDFVADDIPIDQIMAKINEHQGFDQRDFVDDDTAFNEISNQISKDVTTQTTFAGIFGRSNANDGASTSYDADVVEQTNTITKRKMLDSSGSATKRKASYTDYAGGNDENDDNSDNEQVHIRRF